MSIPQDALMSILRICYFLFATNNPQKILQFNTSQKKFAFYEIFVHGISIRKIV